MERKKNDFEIDAIQKLEYCFNVAEQKVDLNVARISFDGHFNVIHRDGKASNVILDSKAMVCYFYVTNKLKGLFSYTSDFL